MEVVSGEIWSYKACKAPVKCHHQQTTTSNRLDVLPVSPLTGVGSGVCMGSDTPTIYVEGILICISP